MAQDTNVQNLIINKLTKAQYEGIATPSDTELYLTPDTSLSAEDLKTINNTSLVGSGNISVQAVISDLSTIRSGASAGATALQPNDNISELTNNVGYITGITSSDVVTALGYTPYNATNPNGYITASALNGYATESFVTSQGYITNSALTGYATENWVTNQNYVNGTTLAYTLADYVLSSDLSTTLANYVTNSSLTNTLVDYALTSSLANVATSGNYNDLTNKPTIPTVNNGTLTIQKNGTTIGTFTANQSGNSTVNIEADTVLTDDITVSKNTDDELQAIGVIDDNSGNAIKTWTGTKTQYDAIVTKNTTTLYWVTDAKIIYLGETPVGNFSGGRNVGELVTASLPLTDAGLHLLDGALIQGSGIYSAFVDYIAELYGDGTNVPNYFCTENEWQNSITQYGVCGKFVYDNILNTVRLPKVTGIIEGTTDLTALGDLVEAGLPDHSHTYNTKSNTAVQSGSATACWVGDSEATTSNASASNPIYGRSNTVQPQTIKAFCYIVMATSTKTDIQVDIDEIATDLNEKVDKSSLAEVHCVVETYQNGTSGYWIRSDGYCEQWGKITGYSGWQTQAVTFLKPFKDMNYNITACHTRRTGSAYNDYSVSGVINPTTTGMSLNYYGTDATGTIWWRVAGYIEV